MVLSTTSPAITPTHSLSTFFHPNNGSIPFVLILEYLDIQSLCRIEQVNHDFAQIVQISKIWNVLASKTPYLIEDDEQENLMYDDAYFNDNSYHYYNKLRVGLHYTILSKMKRWMSKHHLFHYDKTQLNRCSSCRGCSIFPNLRTKCLTGSSIANPIFDGIGAFNNNNNNPTININDRYCFFVRIIGRHRSRFVVHSLGGLYLSSYSSSSNSSTSSVLPPNQQVLFEGILPENVQEVQQQQQQQQQQRPNGNTKQYRLPLRNRITMTWSELTQTIHSTMENCTISAEDDEQQFVEKQRVFDAHVAGLYSFDLAVVVIDKYTWEHHLVVVTSTITNNELLHQQNQPQQGNNNRLGWTFKTRYVDAHCTIPAISYGINIPKISSSIALTEDCSDFDYITLKVC